MVSILKVFGILCIGISVGKIVSKIKLPAILGWLITGMVFGPYLIKLISFELMDSLYYKIFIKLFECFAGVMIGSEIIISKLAKYGKQITIITIFQSIGTFLVVTLVFSVVCYLCNLPIYLAFIFGGIALATAPAPALSIVNQYKAKGAVTDTLIPLAALDDIIGVVVFFSIISIVSGIIGGGSVSVGSIILMVILPFIIGGCMGLISGFVLKKVNHSKLNLGLFVMFLVLSFGIGLICDKFIFGSFSLNYLLIGMAFSAVTVNMVPSSKMEQIIKDYNPILSISLVIVIIHLGLPLDYHLIAGAGIFTAVYIISRAIGKISFSALGSYVSNAEPTVRKYLGLTLLPHSGVSLVFTGIAVSTLANYSSEYASIIQGTIAAAAIINEIVAVILAKQAFKWAGELNVEENKTETS